MIKDAKVKQRKAIVREKKKKKKHTIAVLEYSIVLQ